MSGPSGMNCTDGLRTVAQWGLQRIVDHSDGLLHLPLVDGVLLLPSGAGIGVNPEPSRRPLRRGALEEAVLLG